MNKININDMVRVKLTEEALEILKTNHETLREAYPKIDKWKSPVDEKGYYETQLWSLFQDFGDKMILGRIPPFIEIEVVR